MEFLMVQEKRYQPARTWKLISRYASHTNHRQYRDIATVGHIQSSLGHLAGRAGNCP